MEYILNLFNYLLTLFDTFLNIKLLNITLLQYFIFFLIIKMIVNIFKIIQDSKEV